jgi:small subunit ribosomal protein S1
MIVNDQNEGKDVKDPIEKEEQKEEKKEVVKETVEEIKAEDAEKVEAKKEKTTSPKTRKKNNNEEDMMSLFDEHFSKFDKGKIVEGTVVSVDERSVLVDIGFKSESAISIREFTNANLPEIGSQLKVFIDSVEDGSGRLRLSKKKADFYLNIDQLDEKMKKNESVQGVLRRRVKGGMIVDIDNLEAFLPGSQISTKPIPNLDQFIGKESDFKILKIDRERRNIIVSRKKVLIEEQESRLKELKAKIVEGSELDGEVRNITDYGAFIDLGGIDGLLHITDMSWGHIKHPSDMLNIGDKVKVKILNYDDKAGKVSLGLKQLVPHPWANIEVKYPEGTIVSGKVVNITNYGVFVELESGVEGLVHISEMSWTKKIKHPKQLLKLGDTIKAIVLTTSREDKRISLGIKQMEPNPWLTIEERYPMDSKIKGVVKSITPFGVFIEIENDIEGLIHISDISWTKRIYHPKEVFQKGQEIEVKILSIDKTLHRIALGVKQLQPDPWENLDKKLPINSEVKANIVKIISKGVLVDVGVDDYTVEGFIPLSHLAIPGLKKAGMAFETEEKLPLKIIELDLENRRLILSVKAYFFARDEKELEDFVDVHTKRITEKTEKRRAIKENLVEETPKKEKEKIEEKTLDEKPVVEPIKQEAPVEAEEKTIDEKPEKIKKPTEEKKKKTTKKKTEKDEKKPAKKVVKKPAKKAAAKKVTVKAKEEKSEEKSK